MSARTYRGAVDRKEGNAMRYSMLVAVAALVLAGLPGSALADGDPAAAASVCAGTDEATLAIVDCNTAAEDGGSDETGSAVPTLDAAFTAAWKALQDQSLPAWCRLPAKVLVYTSSDWVRAAQKLAGDASMCAEIFLSIPPLAADKTNFRVLQDDIVRAVSPQIHPVAEINVTGWSGWVNTANTNRTWFQAGVEARTRMQAAGYRVEDGEIWAVNEFSSAVRRGDGNARANMRAFVRGLHDGASGMSAVRGAVFVVGLDQRLADTSVYKATLKGFLGDDAFWAEMAANVRFFAQETYPDSRSWGVPGSSRNERARYFNDYLQHLAELSEAGPSEIAVAQRYLRASYLPLASAAWPWKTAFGDTDIAVEQMQNFVSTQTFAIRHYAGSHPNGAPGERIGFAYAPNGAAVSRTDFASGNGLILDRLASSLSHAYDRGGGSQLGACGPPGEHDWCESEREGAVFNAAWQLLQSWD
jgi:hypothetical protein